MSYHTNEWFEENFVREQVEFLRSGKKYNLETDLKEHGGLTEPMQKKRFEVGKMYTFSYKDPKYKKELDFYNAFPIGICIGHTKGFDGKENPIFLALQFIPPKIRLKVLDQIVKIFSNSVIEPNIKRLNRGNLSLKPLRSDYSVLKKILAGSGFQFAIRSYIYKRIKTQPMIISYVDWWKVGTFSSKYIKKMNIQAIYFMYKQTLNDGHKVGTKEKPVKLTKLSLADLRKKR